VDFVAIGQIGLTGVTAKVAKPIAASISLRTGRPQGQKLAVLEAAFLAVSPIDFLRTVDAVFVGFAVLARITAQISSAFIDQAARARARQQGGTSAGGDRDNEQLSAIAAQLARLEERLGSSPPS